MSEEVADQSPRPASVEDGEISFLDLAIVLAKHKKLVLGLPLITGIVAIVVSLQLPLIYTSTTKILPPQNNQAAMLGQLASQMGALAGAALRLSYPNELYIGLLRSRTVSDNLIDRFELKKVYGVDLYQSARQILESRTSISTSKDGIVTVEVDDGDPKRAAEMANGYLEELYKLTQVLAVTEASQRRLFFERQLELARNNLAKAESVARQALDKGGLAAVDTQSRSMLENTARLRAEISVKEIQVSAMRAFATDRNPQLQQTQIEVDAMKRELSKIEGGGVRGKEAAGGSARADGMDNLRLIREMKYNEVVYELLARQFEMAKIDEAKDASLIQVLDKALVPERKSKPKRATIVILAVLAAAFIAILWVFVSEALERMRRDPDTSQRLDRIRRYLRWR
jgi:tyrosine-protein kinase Etk/Wzc